MSTPGYAEPGRGVYVEKPKSNVYTVMLALSLVALIVACLFLVLECVAYEWERKPPPAIGQVELVQRVDAWLA